MWQVEHSEDTVNEMTRREYWRRLDHDGRLDHYGRVELVNAVLGWMAVGGGVLFCAAVAMGLWCR